MKIITRIQALRQNMERHIGLHSNMDITINRIRIDLYVVNQLMTVDTIIRENMIIMIIITVTKVLILE